MGGLFQIKELPFLLTLLFTMMGWVFMKLSDAVISSPTIEYKLVKENERKDTCNYYYRIRNLTANKKFKNLGFSAILPTDTTGKNYFIQSRFDAVFPANQDQVSPQMSNFSCSFSVIQFNPGEEYHLHITINGAKSLPKISIAQNNEDVVMLRESSLFTLLIRKQWELYLFLFIVLLGFIALYFFLIARNTPKII